MASAAQNVSIQPLARTGGPSSQTCATNASASSDSGIAITCACRSPTSNEKNGNSLIVSGITRDCANQSKLDHEPVLGQRLPAAAQVAR